MLLFVAGSLLIISRSSLSQRSTPYTKTPSGTLAVGYNSTDLAAWRKAVFHTQREIGTDDENAILMIVWKKGTSWEDRVTWPKTLDRFKTLTCRVSFVGYGRTSQWQSSNAWFAPCTDDALLYIINANGKHTCNRVQKRLLCNHHMFQLFFLVQSVFK